MYGWGRWSYAGRGWRMGPRGGYVSPFPPTAGLALIFLFAAGVLWLHILPLLFLWWVIPFFVVPAVGLSIRGLAGLLEARSRRSVDEKRKEKELLEALARCGEISAARLALETSLSLTEADRMLSELAKNGHVRVRAHDGRLSYALWEHDRPELTG